MKEVELQQIIKNNQDVIESASNNQSTNDDDQIVIEKLKIEVREKIVHVDKHIIQASDSARYSILETERLQIQQDLER